MKLHFKVDHARRRRDEYMPVGDQLDAVLKGFEALRKQGVELPRETLDWIAHCRCVKSRICK
ncbi:hypothetical protein [Burkholderia gladioli]|uniref:hypothetical protein n=1 Tax=Burkholderia gladioli TaxID=28095 RepID=UPI001640BE17|nr:hypothetical protein [Burkholderia gladioli]